MPVEIISHWLKKRPFQLTRTKATNYNSDRDKVNTILIKLHKII